VGACLLGRPSLGWLLLNLVVGLLPALALWTFAREWVRAIVAWMLGLRVFEIQWGAGRELVSIQLGSCAIRVAAIPLVGAVEAASASPRLHRLKRAILAISPLAAQGSWALWGAPTPARAGDGLMSGFAPVEVVALANLGLIGLHLLLPFETRSGLRSDIRRILDLLSASPSRGRTERAIYYAQATQAHVRRGDPLAARRLLDQGLVALGPEPVLTRLSARLDAWTRNPASRPRAFDLADRAASSRFAFSSERHRLTPIQRIRHATLASSPLVLALSMAAILARAPLSEALQTRWIRITESVVDLGDPDSCRAALESWSTWTPRIDRLTTPSASVLRERHDALARLHGCLGDSAAAVRHQRQALAAVLQESPARSGDTHGDARSSVQRDLEIAVQLRRLAHWQLASRAYRESLASLDRIRDHLEHAQRQLSRLSDPVDGQELAAAIALEEDESDLGRARVLDRMGAARQARSTYEALLARRRDEPSHDHPEFLDHLQREYAAALDRWEQPRPLARRRP
jgi:hypothetical protein